MTTLYRPVKITSAEQAEALPEGAIVIDDCGDRYTRSGNDGEFWGQADDGTQLSIALAIGNVVTALVPIEAEEVWGSQDKSGGISRAHAGAEDPHATVKLHIAERAALGHPDRLVSHYVTHWEEA